MDPLVNRLAAAPEMHRGLCGGHVFGSEVIHHALPSVVECWSYRSSKSIKWTPPGPDGWRVGSLPRSIQRRMVRIDTPAISATWRIVYKRLGLFITIPQILLGPLYDTKQPLHVTHRQQYRSVITFSVGIILITQPLIPEITIGHYTCISKEGCPKVSPVLRHMLTKPAAR